ncbi:helix-turn-helix transcriptional regulator [Marinobacterium lutimaris]|uniref:Transcriptional regulator, AraC family n=1 Tax=Marinobacterium lutimaris TaxID=568106 RepID=A0A1H6D8F7_9GAMM|nr:AraC family transcriptional regulator [Marinobacterium lutimaris]SEG81512.1 transcriptional regulator, AraC family [Marinobacterium lutimaris]
MQHPATLTVQTASTRNVAPEQRFQYWDQFNASHFVGIRCSSYVPEGLAATQHSLHLDGMKLNWIEGNGHVVERDLTLVQAEPKESVLVSIGMGKNAFFHQGKSCEMLEGQYALLYRTDRPYLVGFTDQMHQLTIDIPLEKFHQHSQYSFDSPLRIDTHDRLVNLLIRSLYRQVNRFMQTPDAGEAEAFQRQAWRLIDAMLVRQNSAGDASSVAMHHRLMAKQYMDENLGRADLGVEEVAAALGITSRHLNRLFSEEALTPRQYLLDQRLQQAWALLTDPRRNGYGIADVAYQCGFSSQAYFARVFRRQFGLTPTDARQKHISAPLG